MACHDRFHLVWWAKQAKCFCEPNWQAEGVADKSVNAFAGHPWHGLSMMAFLASDDGFWGALSPPCSSCQSRGDEHDDTILVLLCAKWTREKIKLNAKSSYLEMILRELQSITQQSNRFSCFIDWRKATILRLDADHRSVVDLEEKWAPSSLLQTLLQTSTFKYLNLCFLPRAASWQQLELK
jgi:hypothetical protein